MLFSKSLLAKLQNVHITHWLGLDFKQGSLNRLGLISGLTIPACAIPLITVLLGQSLLLGDFITGFVALFVFGLALTVPLAAFSLFKRGIIWLRLFSDRAEKLRIAGGIVLVLIGVATYFSGSFWSSELISVPS
ncbi:hypothetical protein D1AOALGA4SA_2155 [Olavius algarvensis Delta 1 endosymbiont]|nr:hypothetical protein D1AOALGA4SA_2155 [Olavius algarvensis Delta 1 endosymbiont]